MLNSPFPILLDSFDPRAPVWGVVEVLLLERVIFAWPEPADVDRPPLPYTALAVLSDRGLGHPGRRLQALGPDDSAVEDVRQYMAQQREAVVRAWCYGAGAHARARRIAVGYRSQGAKALWGDAVLQPLGEVEDATRLIGNHNEFVAYVDIRVRYQDRVGEDLYSIQSTTTSVAAEA